MSSARVPKEEPEVITIVDTSDSDGTPPMVPWIHPLVVAPEVIDVDSSPSANHSLLDVSADQSHINCETKGEALYNHYLEGQRAAGQFAKMDVKKEDVNTEVNSFGILDRARKSEEIFGTLDIKGNSLPNATIALETEAETVLKSESATMRSNSDEDSKPISIRAAKPEHEKTVKLEQEAVKPEPDSLVASRPWGDLSMEECRQHLKILNSSPERRRQNRERMDELYGSAVDKAARFITRSERPPLDNAIRDITAIEALLEGQDALQCSHRKRSDIKTESSPDPKHPKLE